MLEVPIPLGFELGLVRVSIACKIPGHHVNARDVRPAPEIELPEAHEATREVIDYVGQRIDP